MSGFSDSVVAGKGVLIREFIQSSNYAPGTDGWTINKDGSAEFNNLTVRGTVILSGTDAILFYYPSAGSGNLFLSIAPQNGTDAYGNTYAQGLEFHDYPLAGSGLTFDTIAAPGSIYRMYVDTSGGVDTLRIVGPNNSGFQIEMADAIVLASADRVAVASAGLGLQIGAGDVGLYYDEQYTGFTPNLASGALTTIDPTSGTHKIRSDYGASAWAGSTWTCPVDSPYTFHSYFPNIYDGDWANVHRHLINGTIVDSAGVNAGAVHSPGIASLHTTIDLVAGDTFTMTALQNSGAARAIGAASRIHIHREV